MVAVLPHRAEGGVTSALGFKNIQSLVSGREGGRADGLSQEGMSSSRDLIPMRDTSSSHERSAALRRVPGCPIPTPGPLLAI